MTSRKEIFDLVAAFSREHHAPLPFVPGASRVPYAGRVFDQDEVKALVDAALDFTLTMGNRTAAFEKLLRDTFRSKSVLYCHSGSSANLLAAAALASRNVLRPLRAGDEVITSALAFPTTITSLLRYGLTPVFVDVEPATLNPRVDSILEALSDKTRAIFLAHTLGNPFDALSLQRIARERGLRLVEDCCDALGSKLNGRLVGSFGDLATLSFYPAHHITTGEGGALIVNDPALRKSARSIRDWGRACTCRHDEPDPNGRCGKRFEKRVEEVVYDHRYIYNEQGFNLKGTDLGAAIGIVQMGKRERFELLRQENFDYLRQRLVQYDDVILAPRWLDQASPSWFAYPIIVRDGAAFTRAELQRHLTERKIDSRPIFSGNILRHGGFAGIACRIPAPLDGCNQVLRNGLFIGIYPGITAPMRSYLADTMEEFLVAHGS